MNTTARAFADEATALSSTTIPAIAGVFAAAVTVVSTLFTVLHAAHLA